MVYMVAFCVFLDLVFSFVVINTYMFEHVCMNRTSKQTPSDLDLKY